MRSVKEPSRFGRIAVALLAAAMLAPPVPGEAHGSLRAAVRLEAGRLLVARPGMVDPNFAETVVLLLDHGDDGALGVIVNRPSRIALSALLPDVELLAERPELVFRGGPVAVNQLIFTLRVTPPPADCEPVLADVCASGSLELLEKTLAAEPPAFDFRGFAGYAGWAAGQLEWEIEQGGWYVLAGDSRRVFDAVPGEIWSDLVKLAESPVARNDLDRRAAPELWDARSPDQPAARSR